MFNKILVAYDGSPSSRAAIQQAYALAKVNNAEVTVLSVAPSVAALAGLSGVSIEELGAELKEWADQTAREGASTAPGDANVHTITRSGHVGEEIVSEIGAGGYDLVVLGSRGRGRLVTDLFGSANGYVHFHSKVPLLTISGDETDSEVVGETALRSSAAH
jgi:nucleotide-binding universal stress UspA family protein